MTELKIIYKDINDLIPYVNNARTHNDKQVTQIASSIKEFGFNNPILLDGANGVIAGHGRLLAAQKLKLDKVPCVELGHLSEQQKKAYILADNKIALNSDWDSDLLKLELEALNIDDFDFNAIGFNDDEISDLLTMEDEQLEQTEQEIQETQFQTRIFITVPETLDDPRITEALSILENIDGVDIEYDEKKKNIYR